MPRCMQLLGSPSKSPDSPHIRSELQRRPSGLTAPYYRPETVLGLCQGHTPPPSHNCCCRQKLYKSISSRRCEALTRSQNNLDAFMGDKDLNRHQEGVGHLGFPPGLGLIFIRDSTLSQMSNEERSNFCRTPSHPGT